MNTEQPDIKLFWIKPSDGNAIDEACFAQFLLSRHAERLEIHAHAKGLSLVGDLPFFVSPDSSDVWAHPGLFLLDASGLAATSTN